MEKGAGGGGGEMFLLNMGSPRCTTQAKPITTVRLLERRLFCLGTLLRGDSNLCTNGLLCTNSAKTKTDAPTMNIRKLSTVNTRGTKEEHSSAPVDMLVRRQQTLLCADHGYADTPTRNTPAPLRTLFAMPIPPRSRGTAPLCCREAAMVVGPSWRRPSTRSGVHLIGPW